MNKIFDRTTTFGMKQAAMSNEELAELVQKEVSKLCKTGGKSLHMSIPSQITDTDMIICEMLRRFKKLTRKQNNGV